MMLQNLSEVMCALCKAFSKDTELAALDIASGYHSYAFKIKDYQKKV